MKGKLLSCSICFCVTRLSLSEVCQVWGVSELQGIGRISQGLSVRVGSCQEEVGDFGERFAAVVPCLLPQPVSLLCLLFSLSAGDVVQSPTQLTHYLVSMPFYSCINLLLLPARSVLSEQLLLTCSASQPPEKQWRGEKLPLQRLLQGEGKGKVGTRRDEAWRETWRRVTTSCCCPTYSSCPFGNSRKLHV